MSKEMRQYIDNFRNSLTENSNKKLFDIAKELSEKMYCDVFGSCVHFAELFVEKVEEENAMLLGDFNVIEGYVLTNDGKFEHTWIELKNGEKIDPTFKQFIGTVKKITKKKSYTGYEYLNDSTDTWFKERRKQYPHYVFKYLNEGKSVGKLYHFTHEKSLEKILNDNKMIGSFMYEIDDVEIYGVSTTRNKNLNYDHKKNNIRITLNGDMLSNNYKIQPRDYWAREYNVPGNPQTIDEDEEVVLTPKGYIFNIKKYIISIDKIS